MRKNLNIEGVLPDVSEVTRTRRHNSDDELSFRLPMISDDYDKVKITGHVQDERGQYYVINDRSRNREGKKRIVQFDCMHACIHVMFKLFQFKFPYSSYIEEAYGVNITKKISRILDMEIA